MQSNVSQPLSASGDVSDAAWPPPLRTECVGDRSLELEMLARVGRCHVCRKMHLTTSRRFVEYCGQPKTACAVKQQHRFPHPRLPHHEQASPAVVEPESKSLRRIAERDLAKVRPRLWLVSIRPVVADLLTEPLLSTPVLAGLLTEPLRSTEGLPQHCGMRNDRETFRSIRVGRSGDRPTTRSRASRAIETAADPEPAPNVYSSRLAHSGSAAIARAAATARRSDRYCQRQASRAVPRSDRSLHIPRAF